MPPVEQRRAKAEAEPELQWEPLLAYCEHFWKHDPADISDDLQLVIALQLRELLLAVRPILKHPMIRRLIDNGNR